MSGELIEHLFLPAFGAAADAELGDSAVVLADGVRLAFSTDSFVVKPLVFPGGSIGDLAVNGTVNDLAMSGAMPLVLSTAFILEEGTSLADLGRVADRPRRGGRRGRRTAGHRRHQGGRRGARRPRVHQHLRDRAVAGHRRHLPGASIHRCGPSISVGSGRVSGSTRWR